MYKILISLGLIRMRGYRIGKNLWRTYEGDDVFEAPDDEMVEDFTSLSSDSDQVINY